MLEQYDARAWPGSFPRPAGRATASPRWKAKPAIPTRGSQTRWPKNGHTASSPRGRRR